MNYLGQGRGGERGGDVRGEEMREAWSRGRTGVERKDVRCMGGGRVEKRSGRKGAWVRSDREEQESENTTEWPRSSKHWLRLYNKNDNWILPGILSAACMRVYVRYVSYIRALLLSTSFSGCIANFHYSWDVLSLSLLINLSLLCTDSPICQWHWIPVTVCCIGELKTLCLSWIRYNSNGIGWTR